MEGRRSREGPGEDYVGDGSWLDRFGARAPFVARQLLERVRGDGDVEEAAAALGVLRAQEGRSIDGLLADVLALRGEGPGVAVDLAVIAAGRAFADEHTAMLQREATRDPLTGLANRAAFDAALGYEVAAAGRLSAPSLLLVDLDGFKNVNDTDGHLAGDEVLRGTAALLTENLRRADICARLGGDEFAVLLPRTGRSRAAAVARRLLTASRDDDRLRSPNARVTLSIGVGHLRHPEHPDALVAAADAAMYRAKSAGGDGVDAGAAGDAARAVPA